MAYREVLMIEVHEVIRRLLMGHGLRAIAASTGLDRKTVRRYADSLRDLHALDTVPVGGGVAALVDALAPQVMASLRVGAPPRPRAHEALWAQHGASITAWHNEGVPCPKMVELLHRQYAVSVPLRTLQRLVQRRLGRKGPKPTTWVADCAPGEELQVDFAELGWTEDLQSGKRRKLFAFICTAVHSRHCLVWPTWTCTTVDVLEGLQAAFEFFGGVFKVVIFDNAKAAVLRADPTNPALHPAVLQFQQAHGFVLDPARVRRPQDKARVERNVQYVQGNMFAGESSMALSAWREYARRWSEQTAGMRLHGMTCRRPAEHFAEVELPALLALPAERWQWAHQGHHNVGRDGRFRLDGELYAVAGLVGEKLWVRADRRTVTAWHHGRQVLRCDRVGKGQTGGDPAVLQSRKLAVSQRNAPALLEQAAEHGSSVGEVARMVLGVPPWFGQVRKFKLLMALCEQYGSEAVERACAAAVSLQVYDVLRIRSRLELGVDTRDDAAASVPPAAAAASTPATPAPESVSQRPRFSRSVDEFRRPAPAASGAVAQPSLQEMTT